MANRKRPYRAPKAAKPASQIKKIAVNLNGWAVEDSMKNRGIHQLITARAPIQASYNSVISNNVGQRHIFRQTKGFTAAEQLPPTDCNRQYVIVGYAPRSVPHDEYSTKNKAYGKHGRKTMGTTSPANVIPWDKDTILVLVVAELNFKPNEGVKFWALLWQVDGLCTPFAIRNDSIFFRWEYRTLALSLKATKAAWIENVAKTVETLGRRGDPEVHTSLDVCKTESVSPVAKRDARGTEIAPEKTRSNEHCSRYPIAGPSSSNVSSRTFAYPRQPSHGVHIPPPTFEPSSKSQNTLPSSQTTNPSPQKPSKQPKSFNALPDNPSKPSAPNFTAEQASFTAKEAAITNWRDSLQQEKRVFEQGISFQANKLTEREKQVETRERRVYERERHVQVRENDIEGREARAEGWEEELRTWVANLTERGRISFEREAVYQDNLARLKAREKELSEREEAAEEAQRDLDEGLDQAMKSLAAVQQSRKRAVESDADAAGGF
ncbi:hypothetical protein IFR04_012688 [Cadophora malorum]|uniref:Uncharacterized protein n=1 Tax=Cadophora malorum TaxID=108018 RepID=A0A8H7W195_9HELO|nr:hypothetical protein IFR04_012688 [Cadophora malorum]